MNASEMVGHMGCDSLTPLQTVSLGPIPTMHLSRVAVRVFITIW